MKRSAYAKTALLFAMLLGGTAFQGDGSFGCTTGPLGGNSGADGGTAPDGGVGKEGEGHRDRGPDGGTGKEGEGPGNKGPDGGSGKMDPPPEGSAGANLASCTCKDGKTFAGCIAADCSSQPDRERRCAEACGARGMAATSCQLKAEMCASPPPPPPPPPGGDMPGVNLASCSCKSGKMFTACIAADCSSQPDRERRCAEACGGSGVAATSCQLKAEMCASPPPPPPEPQPNRAKCTCKDGKTFEGCVPFDCSIVADRESKCGALCGSNGGFGSSSCELKSSMCVPK